MEREEESDLTDDSAYSIPEEEEDDNFTWTQEQFDALIEGDLDNKGKGGTNYKDIIKNTDYQTPSLTPLSEAMIREKSPISPLVTRSRLLPLTLQTGQWTTLARPKHAVGLGLEKARNKTILKPESKFKYQKRTASKTVRFSIRIHLRLCRSFVRLRRPQERCKVFQRFQGLRLTIPTSD